MKIGIDVLRANNENKTGVEWYAYFLIEELKKEERVMRDGERVEFILYTDKSLKGELADLPDGWTQKVLRWPPRRFWTQIRLSWEMLVHRPDVLCVPAHVVPLIHPKKTVMTVHDIAATKFPGSYNWFERWYSLWSVKYALKNVWQIITPSEFTKQELVSMQVGKYASKKIHVVHHGYDKRFKKNIDEFDTNVVMKKYGLQKPFIMSIGRLEEKKNTRRIIEAFDIIRNKEQGTRNQLLLVGKPGYGYEHVEKAIEQSPYKKDIKIPGWVDQEDLSILLSSADVFVFPSLYEGFGLPVLEAMASGTPVVASQGSSLEEVGGYAVTYIDPMNSDDIALAILNVMQHDTYRKEQIEKGLDRVKEFSWEKCARETMNVLLS